MEFAVRELPNGNTRRITVAHMILLATLVLLPASEQPFYTCQPVNRSKVSSFCSNVTLPTHACYDITGYDYHKDEHRFKKQAAQCSTHKKAKET